MSTLYIMDPSAPASLSGSSSGMNSIGLIFTSQGAPFKYLSKYIGWLGAFVIFELLAVTLTWWTYENIIYVHVEGVDHLTWLDVLGLHLFLLSFQFILHAL